MSERYIIWGTQIGMLKSYLEHGHKDNALKLLEKIEEEQFLFHKNGSLHTSIRDFMDRLLRL